MDFDRLGFEILIVGLKFKYWARENDNIKHLSW